MQPQRETGLGRGDERGGGGGGGGGRKRRRGRRLTHVPPPTPRARAEPPPSGARRLSPKRALVWRGRGRGRGPPPAVAPCICHCCGVIGQAGWRRVVWWGSSGLGARIGARQPWGGACVPVNALPQADWEKEFGRLLSNCQPSRERHVDVALFIFVARGSQIEDLYERSQPSILQCLRDPPIMSHSRPVSQSHLQSMYTRSLSRCS